MYAKSLPTLFFAAFLAVIGNTAWAESRESRLARQDNCPAGFDVVDLARWIFNDEGKTVLDYGGVLYKVTPSDKLWQDTIRCFHPDDLDGRVQVLDGQPVPLVKRYRDGDLGFRYIRKPYGDYVHDNLGGYVTPIPPNGSPLARIDKQNRRVFLDGLETAHERGKVVSTGGNFTCSFNPENPTPSDEGSYACLVTIDGAPFQAVYILCGRWVGGCSAEFSVTQEISIRLAGGHLHRAGEAAQVESIPEAIEFWTKVIRASIDHFEANVVERGREAIVRGGN